MFIFLHIVMTIAYMNKEKTNLKILGECIRELRKSKNLTQFELAEKIGLSTNFIGMVERGERNTTVDKIFKLADAFNITMEEFFKKL